MGDPVPWFNTKLVGHEGEMALHTLGGRYIVLSFVGQTKDEKYRPLYELIANLLPKINIGQNISCLVASCDSWDLNNEIMTRYETIIDFICDYDGALGRLYGLSGLSETEGGENLKQYEEGITLLLDPTLRVMEVLSLNDIDEHNKSLQSILENLPPPKEHGGLKIKPPIIIIPRVLESELCHVLIEYFKQSKQMLSGSIRNDKGKMYHCTNSSFKKRYETFIQDVSLIKAIRERVFRRIAPEIVKVFQYNITQLSEYKVSCYNADTGGYFRPHRDNTIEMVDFRKLAVSINLNFNEYEGGDLNFPEYGSETYRPPQGGAIIFSASVLHQCTPITKGKRYTILQFLYDDRGLEGKAKYIDFINEAAKNTDPEAETDYIRIAVEHQNILKKYDL